MATATGCSRRYAYIEQDPNSAQTNGLIGRDLHCVRVWTALQPSARDVFLTLTHRLYGSKLADGTDALSLVTKMYRIAPGTGATATDAGSCGGAGNRMIMSMDPMLHAAQIAAITHQGAQPTTSPTSDVLARLARPRRSHAPFDLSDETNDGAPRGQTQYFGDPASADRDTRRSAAPTS